MKVIQSLNVINNVIKIIDVKNSFHLDKHAGSFRHVMKYGVCLDSLSTTEAKITVFANGTTHAVFKTPLTTWLTVLATIYQHSISENSARLRQKSNNADGWIKLQLTSIMDAMQTDTLICMQLME